jgi:hypothetical protein
MRKFHLLLTVCLLMLSCTSFAAAPRINIEDTVVKMALADGVSFDDAVEDS